MIAPIELVPGGASRDERARALARSAEVTHAVAHPALIPVERVLRADDGIVLVMAWFPGELLRSPAERRDDPGEAGNRFARLPADEVAAALDQVIDLHVQLDGAGWLAGDLYDGCLMYDFTSRAITVMDFECYRRGSAGTPTTPPGRSPLARPGPTRTSAPRHWQSSSSCGAGRVVREGRVAVSAPSCPRRSRCRATSPTP